MKKVFILLLLLATAVTYADIWVNEYCRSDGYLVKGHYVPDAPNSPTVGRDYSDSLSWRYNSDGTYNYDRCDPLVGLAKNVVIDSGKTNNTDNVARISDLAVPVPPVLPQIDNRSQPTAIGNDTINMTDVEYAVIKMLYNSKYRDPLATVAMGAIFPGGASFCTGEIGGGVIHTLLQVGAPIFITSVLIDKNGNQKSGEVATYTIIAISVPLVSKIVDMAAGYGRTQRRNKKAMLKQLGGNAQGKSLGQPLAVLIKGFQA